MATQEDRSKPAPMQKWTTRELVREIALILSASTGIIAVLMLLKGLQTLI